MWNELENAVDNINYQLWDSVACADDVRVDVSYRDREFIVTYMGSVIFNTVDDMRAFDEETDEYEPVYNYLVREIKRINKEIRYIKLTKELQND